MPKALAPWDLGLTGPQFQAWMQQHRLRGPDVCRILGLSPNTVTRYKRWGAPLVVRWACYGYDLRYLAPQETVSAKKSS